MGKGITFAGDGSQDVTSRKGTEAPNTGSKGGPITFTKGNSDGARSMGTKSPSMKIASGIIDSPVK